MSKQIDGTEFACLTINAFLEEELKEKDKRIAELEEQLKNAIVPKFKVGQEVWFVYGKGIKKCTIFMLHIDKGGVVYEGYVDDTRYSICCKDKSVYATKEEAEAKLQQMKGDQNPTQSY